MFPRLAYLTNATIILHCPRNCVNDVILCPRLLHVANICARHTDRAKHLTTKLCHMYRQSVQNRQVANSCTSSPFPQRGKHPQEANVCHKYTSRGNPPEAVSPSTCHSAATRFSAFAQCLQSRRATSFVPLELPPAATFSGAGP